MHEDVERLRAETEKALKTPNVVEKFKPQGIEPMPLSPTEIDALIRREIVSNIAIAKAHDRNNKLGLTGERVRPWLQAFHWRTRTYSPEYILKQVGASNQHGGDGFLFWNAANDYSKPFAAMPVIMSHNMVDAIVSTGANIVDQDFFEALGFRHWVADETLKSGTQDTMLMELAIDRIYDTLIAEDELHNFHLGVVLEMLRLEEATQDSVLVCRLQIVQRSVTHCDLAGL